MIAFVSLADVGDSLREAFFMFWETLWALVLGFTLSGAVQAFVSKRQMQRVMGDHRPPAVARASGVRHGVVELFVRGDRDGEVAVPKGRRLHHRDGLHVRVDEPRRRARHRAARADGLAVRGRGVHRRPDHDHRPRAGRRLRVHAEARARGAGARRARGHRARSRARRTTITAGRSTSQGRLERRGARSRCPTSGCCAASS